MERASAAATAVSATAHIRCCPSVCPLLLQLASYLNSPPFLSLCLSLPLFSSVSVAAAVEVVVGLEGRARAGEEDGGGGSSSLSVRPSVRRACKHIAAAAV